MKKTINILFAILFIAGTGFAQDADQEKAKKILDRASQKTKGYKTLTIKFGVTITNPDTEEPIGQKGTIRIKDGKYRLDMTDQEVYNNGKVITTYLKEDNECYKSDATEVEEDMISPEELLTIWEDGYNYKYGGETDYAKSKCDIIFLYPKQNTDSKFHTIKLIIDQVKGEVVWVHLKGRDGSKMTYKLVEMTKDVEMDDSIFDFNEGEHPGVECYDE